MLSVVGQTLNFASRWEFACCKAESCAGKDIDLPENDHLNCDRLLKALMLQSLPPLVSSSLSFRSVFLLVFGRAGARGSGVEIVNFTFLVRLVVKPNQTFILLKRAR